MIRKIVVQSRFTDRRGVLTVVQDLDLFQIRRAFWVTEIPDDARRGGHAHRELFQFLIPVVGEVIVKALGPGLVEQTEVLRAPAEGLHVPPQHWLDISFAPGTVLLVLASDVYKTDDYIHDFAEFKKLVTPVR